MDLSKQFPGLFSASTVLAAAAALALASSGAAAQAAPSPPAAAGVTNVSGAWKGTATVVSSQGAVKRKVTIYMGQTGTGVVGGMPDKLGKCGSQFDPLGGTFDGSSLSFTMEVGDHDADTCELLCTGAVHVTATPLDNAHLSGGGIFEQCHPGQPNEELDISSFQVTKFSGMQTPTDPDGAGPGVPLDQMGSGEPGTEGASDLAISRLAVTKRVTLTAGKPSATAKVTATIQNRGQHTETIDSLDVLQSLATLEIHALNESVAGAADAASAIPAQIVAPAKFPIVLKRKQQVKVVWSVTIDTAIDPAATTKTGNHGDYRFVARVDHDALGGMPDNHAADDVAPRGVTAPFDFDTYPDGKIKEKGVGAKLADGTLGGDVVLDVVVKG